MDLRPRGRGAVEAGVPQPRIVEITGLARNTIRAWSGGGGECSETGSPRARTRRAPLPETRGNRKLAGHARFPRGNRRRWFPQGINHHKTDGPNRRWNDDPALIHDHPGEITWTSTDHGPRLARSPR